MTDRSSAPDSLDRVGRYEVLGVIGRGAFAHVVRAWDDSLACHVAIKVLNDVAARDPFLRGRFVEEGQLLRRVHSDHVIGVHDVGALDDGRPYLVVDLAEGGTLADRLEQHGAHPADADSIRRIVMGVADGLAALHEAGIVHRDIKPENLLIRSATGGETVIRVGLIATGERLVIGDLGLAKDLDQRGSAPSVIGGSAGFQAPEQLRSDGNIGPATDTYGASAVLWGLVSGTAAPEPHDVEMRLAALPAGWQRFFARGLHMQPEHRHASAIAWRSAALDQLEFEPSITDNGATPVPDRASELCPYKGLAAFQVEDAGNFFGREALVRDLVHRLSQHRVLVIAGPSGSGKSSLLRAGLVPALRSGALPDSESWRIEVMTPGAQPLKELHYRMSRWAGDAAGRISLAALGEDPSLARQMLDDADCAGGESGASQERVVRVLCIDQFEEVFTQAAASDDVAARGFIEALASMADPVDSQLRLVLAVRADFYGQCAQVAWLAERITNNQMLVGPMAREDMRRAIEEPARRAGLRLEQGLVDAVLDEGGQSAGSLPLISHALMETWARRSGPTLTLDSFRQAGGVAGAIAKSAEDLYTTSIGDGQQSVAKRLLLRLVTPGEGAADTRRTMPLGELERDAQPVAMRSVVDAFVSARLLSVDDHSAQIAHEALLSSWPRLRAWIDAERENLRTQQRVRRAALDWEASGFDVDLLFRGSRLAALEEWVEQHGDDLDLLEQRFVNESASTRDAAERAREVAVARTHRNRRRATIALAFLALASVIASVVAFSAYRAAQQNAERAEQNFASALGTSALGKAESDPVRSLLLAVESMARSDAPTVDARAALVQARLSLASAVLVPLGPDVSTPGSFRVALRPDGLVAAVAERTGAIRLYDTISGAPLGTELIGHESGPRTLDYTSDGTTLVSGSSDGTVLVWDLSSSDPAPLPRVLFAAKPVVWAIDVSPDDRSVAVASDDGSLYELDLTTGKQIRRLEWSDGAPVLSVAYSPDGEQIVASNRNGRLQSWLRTSDQEQWDSAAQPPGPNLWEIVFNPDGTRFATGGDRDFAIVHDASTGEPIDGAVFGRGSAGPNSVAQIHGLAFTADGQRLIGGSALGAIHSWLVDDPSVETRSGARHTDVVEHGDLSADGTTYVSVGDDKRMRVWRVLSDAPSVDFAGFTDGAYGIAFDPTGTRMIVGDGAGSVHIVDLAIGSRLTNEGVHSGRVLDVAWSHDGATIATIGADSQLLLWDGATGAATGAIEMEVAGEGTVAFSPDDRFLVATTAAQGTPGLVRVFDVGSRSVAAELPDHRQGVRSSAFSADGKWLATADGKGTIRLWDTDDWTLERSWHANEETTVVAALEFSSDGKLASVDSSEDIRVWDPESGAQIGVTVSGLDTGGGRGVGFTSDGTSLAVISQTGKLHLVDWAHGVNLVALPIEAHPGNAKAWDLHFSADDNRFATSGTDGVVRVWDLFSIDAACAAAGRRLDMRIDSDIMDEVNVIGCQQ